MRGWSGDAGDDCISLQTGTTDVVIRNVVCGPGHGIRFAGLALLLCRFRIPFRQNNYKSGVDLIQHINSYVWCSIGGLGQGNSQACVSNITVQDVLIQNTQNGVRIKTWQVMRTKIAHLWRDIARTGKKIDNLLWLTGGLRRRPACDIRQGDRHQRAKSYCNQPVLLRHHGVPERHGRRARQRHLVPQHSRDLRPAPLARPDLLRLQRYSAVPRHQGRQCRALASGTHSLPFPVLLLELLRGFKPLLLPAPVPPRRPLHRGLWRVLLLTTLLSGLNCWSCCSNLMVRSLYSMCDSTARIVLPGRRIST